MSICKNCGKETENPKFCSRSCAAIANNTLYKKRKPKNKCTECGKPVVSSRKHCKNCFKDSLSSFDRLTIGEIKQNNKSWQSNNNIRTRARKVALNNTSVKSCAFCGYDKHVEVCHIKPVSEFPDDATVLEINALENLILLCPNCHWEFDHPQENKNSQTL